MSKAKYDYEEGKKKNSVKHFKGISHQQPTKL